jgi:hypothetical protein
MQLEERQQRARMRRRGKRIDHVKATHLGRRTTVSLGTAGRGSKKHARRVIARFCAFRTGHSQPRCRRLDSSIASSTLVQRPGSVSGTASKTKTITPH